MRAPVPLLVVAAVAGVALGASVYGSQHWNSHDRTHTASAETSSVPASPAAPAVHTGTTASAPASVKPAGPVEAGPAQAAPAAPAGGPVARCAGSALQASFRIDPAGKTAQRGGAVGLRNTSTTACTVSGFPGLQLLGRGDDPISTFNVRDAKAPRAILLAPGQTAWAALTWTVSPAADEPRSDPCQPSAVRLGVNPPDDRTQLYVPYAAGPVCDHGRILIAPLTTVD